MSNTTTIRRNSSQQIKSFRNFMWISMLMSLAVVFFGMQLMMVGPLKGRLDGIQTRLDLSDQNMKQLVGANESVLETNSLLGSLEEQSARLTQMSTTIDEIAALRTKVETEARSTTAAMDKLEQLASVQNRIIADADETRAAMMQVAELESLRKAIIDGGRQTEVADNSLDGIVALQKRVIAASNNYEKASVSIANMTDLTQRLVAGNEDLQVASQKFDEFIGLQNKVIAAANNSEDADAAIRTLVAMKNTLAGDTLKLDVASKNLNQIVELQNQLNGHSTRVAEAIQNLELMDDFQVEVARHVDSLTTLRQSLIEVAMMETMIGRVASVVRPLTEISNLRRLSDREIREAARVIMAQRNPRRTSAHNDNSGSPVMTAEAGSAEETDLVPLPPEANVEK